MWGPVTVGGPFEPLPGAGLVSAPVSAGVGIKFPPREFDCSGVRPSWYPFAFNVCDWVCDDPDPLPFAPRMLTLPEEG